MNHRQLYKVIRDSEKEVQSKKQSIDCRLAYFNLEMAARKVLSVQLTEVKK